MLFYLTFLGLLSQGGLDHCAMHRAKHEDTIHSPFSWQQQSHLLNFDGIISNYKEKGFALFGNLKPHISCSKDCFELIVKMAFLPSIVIGQNEIGISFLSHRGS